MPQRRHCRIVEGIRLRTNIGRSTGNVDDVCTVFLHRREDLLAEWESPAGIGVFGEIARSCPSFTMPLELLPSPAIALPVKPDIGKPEINHELQCVVDRAVIRFGLDQKSAQLARADSRNTRAEKRRFAAPSIAGDDIFRSERCGRRSRVARSVELPKIVGDIAIDNNQLAIGASSAVGGRRHVNADCACGISPTCGMTDLNNRIGSGRYIDGRRIGVPGDTVIIPRRTRPIQLREARARWDERIPAR